jgi:hypothetical protein
MSQPIWKCVANLGDKDPITYGGYFVFIDKTGVYPPEAELLMSPDDPEDGEWEVYRFVLEDCTYACPINRPSVNVNMVGTLSDNKFHPTKGAWFEKSLLSIARFTDTTYRQLVEWFCSDNPCERAIAWKAVADYHGVNNLDDYPLHIESEDEVEERYKDALAELEGPPRCEKCDEPLDTDCQGKPRCPICDEPCPDCFDGGGPSI